MNIVWFSIIFVVLEYLLGDISNNRLFGTILGFSKKINTKFSFFLYLSHETGRVERILFNPSSNSDLKFTYEDLKTEIYTGNSILSENNDQNENIKDSISDISIEKFNNIINSYYPLKLLNLDVLNDGKLNKIFFDTFMIELLRDYLLTFKSYSVTDMKIISQTTHPIYKENFKNVPYNIGCGEVNNQEIKKFNSTQNLTNFFRGFNAYKFIEYNRLKFDNPGDILYINIPKVFNWRTTKMILNKYNFESMHITPSNDPQIIKDLKSYINSRTITDRDDLITKVFKFNERSYNKIMNLYTNGQYNPNMRITDESIVLKDKTSHKGFEMKGEPYYP